MKRFTNCTLGARDVILLLEELHRRGYERMRFFGYLSPNGMAYRVLFIYWVDVYNKGHLVMHGSFSVILELLC